MRSSRSFYKMKSSQQIEKMRQSEEDYQSDEENYIHPEGKKKLNNGYMPIEGNEIPPHYLRTYSRLLNGSAMHSFAMMSTVISEHISTDEEEMKTQNKMYRNSNNVSRIVHPVLCKRDIYVGERSKCKKSKLKSGGFSLKKNKGSKWQTKETKTLKQVSADKLRVPSKSIHRSHRRLFTPVNRTANQVFLHDDISPVNSSITTTTMSEFGSDDELSLAASIQEGSQMSI